MGMGCFSLRQYPHDNLEIGPDIDIWTLFSNLDNKKYLCGDHEHVLVLTKIPECLNNKR